MSKLAFLLSLAAGILIVLVSVYGFALIRQRPGVPPQINRDRLVQIDGVDCRADRDAQFLFRNKSIGQEIIFTLKEDGQTTTLVLPLTAYYAQAPFPLIFLLIGLFCSAIGFLVFVLRRTEALARVFFWTCQATAASIIINGEYYPVRPAWPSFIPAVFLIALYGLLPALLLRFSLMFPQRRFLKRSWWIALLPAVWVVFHLAVFFAASLNDSIQIFRFHQAMTPVFRFYLILYLGASIVLFVLGYRRSESDEERAQLIWIFFGLALGLAPFLLLYQGPQLLGFKPLLSEEVTAVFFIFIPVAFAIAIIRYKLMDIRLVINRSLVYSLLTIVTASIYILGVQVFQRLFARLSLGSMTLATLIGIVLAAATFQPAQKRIQQFVDKAFFRQSYDYRRTILRFNQTAQKTLNRDRLCDDFLFSLRNTLPVQKAGLSVYASAFVSAESPPVTLKGNAPPPVSSLPAAPGLVFARRSGVRTEEGIDFSQEQLLESGGLELLIPLTFSVSRQCGLLGLGAKKSGERFTRDDIELLQAMTNDLILNLERIHLMEEVVYERASKEKLDELNRLKTEFISTVSHELRTPMTSLQSLAEVLRSGKVRDKEKREEFLDLMAAESARLSRFLHNILDFGRIEQQAKTYILERAEIQPVVEEAVGVFRHILDSQDFRLFTSFPSGPVILNMDKDAIKRALINLLDNAIKYSTSRREVRVAVRETGSEVCVDVVDCGIGIPQEEQDKIFEKFYRAPQAGRISPQGAGLGLKVVKHIMEGHRGAVRLSSREGSGSTFSLVFPKS